MKFGALVSQLHLIQNVCYAQIDRHLPKIIKSVQDIQKRVNQSKTQVLFSFFFQKKYFHFIYIEKIKNIIAPTLLST